MIHQGMYIAICVIVIIYTTVTVLVPMKWTRTQMDYRPPDLSKMTKAFTFC